MRYSIGRPRSTKPRSEWWDDDSPMIPEITVDDHEAVDTGLITSTGEPIMRLPEPMGFHKP